MAYAIGNAYRGDLRASCVGSGGNNVWLYRLVQALRQHDTRWGLNWKRGNRGDMSQDAVTYNFSADADEGTTNVYIIDVISDHCGGNPQSGLDRQHGGDPPGRHHRPLDVAAIPRRRRESH